MDKRIIIEKEYNGLATEVEKLERPKKLKKRQKAAVSHWNLPNSPSWQKIILRHFGQMHHSGIRSRAATRCDPISFGRGKEPEQRAPAIECSRIPWEWPASYLAWSSRNIQHISVLEAERHKCWREHAQPLPIQIDLSLLRVSWKHSFKHSRKERRLKIHLKVFFPDVSEKPRVPNW